MRWIMPMVVGVGLVGAAGRAEAQFYYPPGYGGYGWNGWGGYGIGVNPPIVGGGFGGGGGGGTIISNGANRGEDPAGGYFAGLGNYARGEGQYELDDAKAQAINADTMLKWNTALRARQKDLREQQARDQAKQDADRGRRLTRAELEDGTTLNQTLLQILEFDPAAARSSRSASPLNPAAIREIPFEWDSEAITICIDQLTAADSLPVALNDAKYAPERAALQRATGAAIREDLAGDLTRATTRNVSEAINRFRDRFVRETPDFAVGRDEANAYFATQASLVRLLGDPKMKQILAGLEDDKPRTLGDLVGFMQAFNLRFGPATSPRQVGIYEQLAPALEALRADVSQGRPAPNPAATDLNAAARGAFGRMRWDQLQAHSPGK